jgi:subtilase family serine protease
VLPPISYTAVNPPVNGATPKATPGLPSDYEPYLDVEWVHTVSPKTAIRVYYEVGGNYLNAIRYAVLENRCGAISSSVEGFCDPVTTIRALDDVEAQAAAQGQTIFKSSGDYGDQWYCGSPIPATLPLGYPNQQPYQQSNCDIKAEKNAYTDANGNVYQPSIDEEAASPNITVVGGSQFKPSYAPTPGANDLSTVGQRLETVWNDNNTPTPGATPTPSAGTQNCPVKDASGGGPSVIFPKPAWQTGKGVPNDGARDIPDVAIGAASAKPGFFVAEQNNKDPAPTFVAVGGTSIATPMWAGISRLIAQAQGVTRLGNINSRLYELGRLQSSGLHDITSGNNDDNGVVGYGAGPGFDLVTGWGSPDIAKLIAAFPGAFATTMPVDTVVKTPGVAPAGSFTVTNTTSGPLCCSNR